LSNIHKESLREIIFSVTLLHNWGIEFWLFKLLLLHRCSQDKALLMPDSNREREREKCRV